MISFIQRVLVSVILESAFNTLKALQNKNWELALLEHQISAFSFQSFIGIYLGRILCGYYLAFY